MLFHIVTACGCWSLVRCSVGFFVAMNRLRALFFFLTTISRFPDLPLL
jgi:hypothetical protein